MSVLGFFDSLFDSIKIFGLSIVGEHGSMLGFRSGTGTTTYGVVKKLAGVTDESFFPSYNCNKMTFIVSIDILYL